MTTCKSVFKLSTMLVLPRLDIITTNNNTATLGGIVLNLLYLL